MASSEVSASLCCECGASMELVTTLEDAMWLMVYRFANAHAACGFATPLPEQEVVVKRVLPIEDQPEYTGVIEPEDPPDTQIPSES